MPNRLANRLAKKKAQQARLARSRTAAGDERREGQARGTKALFLQNNIRMGFGEEAELLPIRTWRTLGSARAPHKNPAATARVARGLVSRRKRGRERYAPKHHPAADKGAPQPQRECRAPLCRLAAARHCPAKRRPNLAIHELPVPARNLRGFLPSPVPALALRCKH
jgi:hypothetical protein